MPLPSSDLDGIPESSPSTAPGLRTSSAKTRVSAPPNQSSPNGIESTRSPIRQPPPEVDVRVSRTQPQRPQVDRMRMTSPEKAALKESKAFPESLQKFTPGHVLNGRYRIERLIARGGMGYVYLGYQLPLERKVALKILIPQSLDAEFRRRFLLEASINSRLSHQHIVTVHDYGETADKDLFMAMEFLEGEPLSRAIARDVRILPGRACLIASQIARALRAAHRAGVVHRDLKPSNVMLMRDDEDYSGDFVKVMDFGLVKIFGEGFIDTSAEEEDITSSGVMLGSPRYMSPEQIRSGDVDPRTDIYALGVLLFHMIAGRPPFVGQASVEILTQHLKSSPPSMASVGRPDCPMELEVIIQRCLAKSKADRYPSMDELLNDLKAASRLIQPPSGSSAISLTDARRSMTLTSASAGALVPFKTASLAEILTGDFESGPAEIDNELMLAPSAARKRGARWPLVSVLVLIALIGGLGISVIQRQSLQTTEAPWIDITLSSDPLGAEVWLEDSLLGITPLLHRQARQKPNARWQFTFRYPGRADTIKFGSLDKDLYIHAHLKPPSQRALPPPEIGDTSAPKETGKRLAPEPKKPKQRSPKAKKNGPARGASRTPRRTVEDRAVAPKKRAETREAPSVPKTRAGAPPKRVEPQAAQSLPQVPTSLSPGVSPETSPVAAPRPKARKRRIIVESDDGDIPVVD